MQPSSVQAVAQSGLYDNYVVQLSSLHNKHRNKRHYDRGENITSTIIPPLSKDDALLSQPQARSKSPARTPQPRSCSNIVRSHSPIRITAKSSLAARLTSPVCQQKLKSAIPQARGIIGGPREVTLPTPTLRVMASTHSLPGAPSFRLSSMIVTEQVETLWQQAQHFDLLGT